MSNRSISSCCAIAFAAGALILGYAATVYVISPYLPSLGQSVLVGIGCEGSSFVAVAREEDMLPRCETIERHTIENGHD